MTTQHEVTSFFPPMKQWLHHPPHGCPAKFGHVLLYSLYLFGKKLFSMQDKLVNNKQTLSETKLLRDNKTNRQKLYGMLLFNL